MEYIIKDYIIELSKQRKSVLDEINSMNENLPNYSVRIMELNNQIQNIDREVKDYIYCLKDLETMEEPNKYNLKSQELNK